MAQVSLSSNAAGWWKCPPIVALGAVLNARRTPSNSVFT